MTCYVLYRPKRSSGEYRAAAIRVSKKKSDVSLIAVTRRSSLACFGLNEALLLDIRSPPADTMSAECHFVNGATNVLSLIIDDFFLRAFILFHFLQYEGRLVSKINFPLDGAKMNFVVYFRESVLFKLTSTNKGTS